jgi:hypothetical protein
MRLYVNERKVQRYNNMNKKRIFGKERKEPVNITSVKEEKENRQIIVDFVYLFFYLSTVVCIQVVVLHHWHHLLDPVYPLEISI